MLSKKQKAWLKGLQRQAQLADEDYRALFPEVTGFHDCRSSTDLRLNQAHMDDLVARLLAFARPSSLAPQIRQQRQPRVRAEHPLAEVQACLGLYVDDPDGYIARVIADRFGATPDGPRTIAGLSERPRWRTGSGGKLVELPSELRQLVMTLWARVQPMRRASNQSLHDMRTLAGVSCRCATFCHPRPGVRVMTHDAVEREAAGAEEGPF